MFSIAGGANTLICSLGMKQILRILQLLRPYWKFITEAMLISILLSLLSVPVPYFTKILVDDVFPNKDRGLLFFVLILVLSISIFSGFISLLRSYFTLNLSTRMGLNILFKFYCHLQSLDYSFYDRREIGEVLSRFTDVRESTGRTVQLVETTVMNLLTIFIFAPILVYINWKLALLSLAVLPFYSMIFAYTNKYVRRTTKTLAAKNANISAKNYESFLGIRTIQSMVLQESVFKRIRSLILDERRLNIRLGLFQGISNYSINVLRAVGVFLYSWYGWTQILDGRLTLGTFLAFGMYAGYLYGPIQRIIGITRDLQVTLVHANRFFELYDLTPKIRNFPHAHELPSVRGKIGFHNVTFSYDGSDPVLQNIDIEIAAGQTVALVGKSGVGKTTFVQLIPRFYEPQSGTITIDGYDIREVKLESLRRQIGFVHQEPFLFYGTIFENITFGKPDATQWEVKQVAKVANAHEFIKQLPHGYETQVGERGVQLSQGQKQRIALARVLLLNTPILILDEAISAVDSESELKILQALKEIRENKTTIVIAHRLSTIKNADQILVLDGGRIAEIGTHKELLIKDGAFTHLYQGSEIYKVMSGDK